MNEVIREFLLETHENLAQLDLDLVALEKNPQEADTLARAFRTLHTIKGTAGFLGLQKLQAVSHAAENLLSRLREGTLTFNSSMATGLLSTMDAIRQMLSAVEASETDGEGDYSALVARLDELRGGETSPPRQAAPAADTVPVSITSASSAGSTLPGNQVPVPVTDASLPVTHAASDSAIRVDVGLLDKLMNLVGELVLARNQVMQFSNQLEEGNFLSTVQKLNLLTSELQAGVMKTRLQPISTIWSKFPRVVRDLAVACGKQARLELEGQETELDKTIIEAIRDPLTHLVRNAIDHGLESPAERLAFGKPAEGRLALHAFHEGGKVIIEIADDGKGIDPQRVRAKAIQTRLVTSEQADHLNERELVNLVFLPGFSTSDRVTQFSGRGVGMDVVRTNVEKIGGTVSIESRPGQGTTIRLKIPLTLAIIPALTVTSGGHRFAIPQVSLVELVRLEGEQARKGIEFIHEVPVHRLRGNLLPLVYLQRELGLEATTRNTSAKWTQAEFSAARQKHLAWKNRLRDFLDGKQTLTLAEVTSHKDCALGQWLYGEGLAQYGHLPAAKQLEKDHETLHAIVHDIVRFKEAGKTAAAEEIFGRIGPISEKIVGQLSELEKHATSLTLNMVVLQADDRSFGLIVDAIHDTEEIVVKPLSKQLKGINVFAGATIMGDGKVVLILDVLGLAHRSKVVSAARERELSEKRAEPSEQPAGQGQAVLLFTAHDGGRMAIPLAQVDRLEKFPRSAIEHIGPQDVIQYRGEIMPLLHVSRALPKSGRAGPKRSLAVRTTPAGTPRDTVQAVVYTGPGQRVGLVVDSIIDIVDETPAVRAPAHRPGVLFTAVIQGRVTEFPDMDQVLGAADPAFFEQPQASVVEA